MHAIFDSGNFYHISLGGIKNEVDYLEFEGIVDEMSIYQLNDFQQLQLFINKHRGSYIIGYLSYDAKDYFLSDKSTIEVKLPLAYFFVPKNISDKRDVRNIETRNKIIDFKSEVSKEEYSKKFDIVKSHLQRGDIYEINYCVPYSGRYEEFYPLETWKKLVEISPMPFCGFLNHSDFAILSASPERFLKKTGNKLYAVPMKGTSRMTNNDEENLQLKRLLQSDSKERSENIMIVDLTRNDLSKIATKGSVKVTDLCGVYEMNHVLQMTSTIECTLKEDIEFMDVLKACFPMGSMTGAPKISATEIISELEIRNREQYSGTFGLIYPNGDFDFSVLIRTIFQNKTEKEISAWVGSAITIKADFDREYEECALKIKPILKALEYA